MRDLELTAQYHQRRRDQQLASMRAAVLDRIAAADAAKIELREKLRAQVKNRKAFMLAKCEKAREQLQEVNGAGMIKMSYAQVKELHPCTRFDRITEEFMKHNFHWHGHVEVTLKHAVSMGAGYDDITWLMSRAAHEDPDVRKVWNLFKLATRDIDEHEERVRMLVELVER